MAEAAGAENWIPIYPASIYHYLSVWSLSHRLFVLYEYVQLACETRQFLWVWDIILISSATSGDC